MVRAVADAPAAVDAELVYDMAFPLCTRMAWVGQFLIQLMQPGRRIRADVTERMNLLLSKSPPPFSRSVRMQVHLSW